MHMRVGVDRFYGRGGRVGIDGVSRRNGRVWIDRSSRRGGLIELVLQVFASEYIAVTWSKTHHRLLVTCGFR